MKHKIKVVLKETEDRTSKIWLDNDNNKLLFDPLGVMNCNPMYVYITVSNDVEPIEEDDYYIDLETKVVHMASNTHETWENEVKIISTTDPKLRRTGDEGIIDIAFGEELPQLSQSFIKEFVANPNGEWEVEYKNIQISSYINKHTRLNVLQFEKIPKLNQDNTVNITSVEEKMYSREEVVGLLHSSLDATKTTRPRFRKIFSDQLNNWIKENL